MLRFLAAERAAVFFRAVVRPPLAPAERAAVFLRAVARPPLAPAFFTDDFERDVLRAPVAFFRVDVLRRAVDVFLRAPVVLRRVAVVFRLAVDVFFRVDVALRRDAVVLLRELDAFFRAVPAFLRELVAFFRAVPAFFRDELAFFVAPRRFAPDRDADERDDAATERTVSSSAEAGDSSPKSVPPDVGSSPSVEPIVTDGSPLHDVPASSDSVSERSPVSLQSWVMYDLLFGLRA